MFTKEKLQQRGFQSVLDRKIDSDGDDERDTQDELDMLPDNKKISSFWITEKTIAYGLLGNKE